MNLNTVYRFLSSLFSMSLWLKTKSKILIFPGVAPETVGSKKREKFGDREKTCYNFLLWYKKSSKKVVRGVGGKRFFEVVSDPKKLIRGILVFVLCEKSKNKQLRLIQ